MTTLQDITGHESGAVLFPESDEIIICNWTQVNGIPRMFLTGLLGLGEDLSGAKRVAVPPRVKRAMQEHEREQGSSPPSKSGFRAWRVAVVVVVIQEDWA